MPSKPQFSLDSLNPSQQEAAMHVHGPLLVLAGPGSGKTRVVTHRVAHLISQGIPAHQIVALTFTNKAADECEKELPTWLVHNRLKWEHFIALQPAY